MDQATGPMAADRPGGAVSGGRRCPRADATGARRRLQALAYQGWAAEAIARRIPGARAEHIRAVRDGVQAQVSTRRAAAVAVCYDRLWDRRGGSEDTIHLAMRNGWAPALAWDDNPGDPHYIDDPACPVSDWRRRPLRTRLTVDEQAALAELVAQGLSVNQAALRLGMSGGALRRVRDRAQVAS